jgi:hypothetical protein
VSTLNVNNITKYTGGEVVVNDASEDVDFRVESNDDANMLVVDAGNNAVGIGVAAPSGKFEIEDGGTSHGNTLLKVTLDDQSSHYGLSVGNDTYNTADEKGLILQQANDGTGQILVNTTGGIYIDTTGAVTKPNQPAFLATITSESRTGQDSLSDSKYATEIFDNNADYNTGTYTFTAPITGRYQFNVTMGVSGISTGNDMYMRLQTSNRDMDYRFKAGNDVDMLVISMLADMDASDTAKVRYKNYDDGTVEFYAGRSQFSGYLVC